MPDLSGIRIMFVAGFGPVTRDPAASKKLYVDTLGLPLEAMDGNENYYHGEGIDGVKHFAIWPLDQASMSCFGKSQWPSDVPVPSSWMEFDVEDIGSATALLKSRGYRILVDTRKEPWGQTVTRLLSPEGILLGLTVTPWLRN